MKLTTLVAFSLALLGTGLDQEVRDLISQGRSTEAWAVVGRPLTPMSYAGVGRRSSRRVARRTSARYSGGYGYGYGGVGYGAGYVSTLPSGCVTTMVGAVTYQQCGSTYYQPSYQGTTIVYKELDEPPVG